MNRILLIFICLNYCNNIVSQSSDTKKTEIMVSAQFQIGKQYRLMHIEEFSFDSLMSHKFDYSFGPSHSALNGNPACSYVKKKGLIINTSDDEGTTKAIMSYSMAEMDSNYSIYDSLQATRMQLNNIQIDKKKKERAKKIMKWNLLSLDTLYFEIMSNKSMALDTITGVLLDKGNDSEKYYAQRMNKFVHANQLPEYWKNPLMFPHGKLKVGDTYTFLDPENTLDQAPPLEFDYLNADTTNIAFDKVMSELCSSNKNKFIKVNYHFVKILDGQAYFEIDHYYHAYSPNSYDERIFGEGHLVYNIEEQYFSDYALTKKSYSESNLLRFRMSKRLTNTIKWQLALK